MTNTDNEAPFELDMLDRVAITHDIGGYDLKRLSVDRDLTQYDLTEGIEGTVVCVNWENASYIVEFLNPSGDTIALLDLSAKDIRLLERPRMPTVEERAAWLPETRTTIT